MRYWCWVGYNTYATPVSDTYSTVSWTAAGDTPNTDLLGSTNTLENYFDTPSDIDNNTTYEYLITLSRENHDPGETRFSFRCAIWV